MSSQGRRFVSAVAGRLRYLALALPIVVIHNFIHEATHYLLAAACGERVLEVRFLTNWLGTSQVIYASPIAARTGAHWLLIAWTPSLVTTGLGYLLYVSRRRWQGTGTVGTCALYAGFFFLLIDPLYLGVLSVLVGGDIGAAAAVGWSPWIVRACVVPVLIINAGLVRRWMREERIGQDCAPRTSFTSES
jgi:hypothetical protein